MDGWVPWVQLWGQEEVRFCTSVFGNKSVACECYASISATLRGWKWSYIHRSHGSGLAWVGGRSSWQHSQGLGWARSEGKLRQCWGSSPRRCAPRSSVQTPNVAPEVRVVCGERWSRRAMGYFTAPSQEEADPKACPCPVEPSMLVLWNS